MCECAKCVDEWLRVNASCPTCRHSIFQSMDESTTSSTHSGDEEEAKSMISNGTIQLTNSSRRINAMDTSYETV
jgi:hypothetical protein